MDEIFGYMDGRFEVSLADSTMMWIVHYAMNKAQERMKTKTGVLERLNEISKFYELAVMQLEGCLSIVHAETESSFLESNHEEAPYNGNDRRKVEEMGSDIDILKQSLDLAFGKMQSALFMCEMGPKERQWRLTIEKDVMSISIRSFIMEFQKNIEAKARRDENQVLKCWKENWSQLMNDITSLQHELAIFNESTFPEDSDCSALSSPTKSSAEEGNHEMPSRNPHKVQEVDNKEEKSLAEEENESESKFVAKMIKNHESIIRQKSEELNWSKHGKKASNSRKRKELNCLKDRVHVVTERLDNFINWNAKLSESLFRQRTVHGKETLPGREVCEIETMCKDFDTWGNAKEKVKEVSNARNKVQEEISVLDIEKEYNTMQNSISDDMYGSIDGVVEEFDSKSYIFEFEKLIQEHVYKYYLREVINEWNETIERNTIERKIRDDINLIVLFEVVKDICSNQAFALVKCQGGEAEEHCLQCMTSGNQLDEIERTIKEDICMLIFRNIVDEFNKMMIGFKADSIIREHIHQIVFTETLKNFVNIANSALMDLEDYHMENFIREKIHQVVMVETLNDAFLLFIEFKSPIKENNTIEDNCSNMMLNQVQKVQGEENLTIILLESLLSCFEAEENLMLSARSEIKEHSKQLDLGSERGDLHEHEIFEDLLTGEEQTFSSLTSKVENVLQQLGVSKALLKELGTSIGHNLRDSRNFHYQMSNDEDGQLKLSSVFFPLLNLFATFAEFEEMVCRKFEMMTIRELLYQKAFIRRCQNLQKAEAEVDLLGDQVDALLTLLEKIHVTLHQCAPSLQQYFEVFTILELIKSELTIGATQAAK
ncbi:putative WPP domain-associated protein [Sesbania bispinosa]|nr:putative WPP domain-associated protein [Sesbania bispinosa]